MCDLNSGLGGELDGVVGTPGNRLGGAQKALLSSEGGFSRVLDHHEITALCVSVLCSGRADQSSVCLSPVFWSRRPELCVSQSSCSGRADQSSACLSPRVPLRQSWCVNSLKGDESRLCERSVLAGGTPVLVAVWVQACLGLS